MTRTRSRRSRRGRPSAGVRAAVLVTVLVTVLVPGLATACSGLPGGSTPPTTAPPSDGSGSTGAPTTGPSASTSAPGSDPSASPGVPGPVLASKTFTVKGTYSGTKLAIRFDLVDLKRRGELLELRGALTNTAEEQTKDQRWQVAGRYDGAVRDDLQTTDGAFSGAVLTDLPAKKRYLVAADSAGDCVCTTGLSSTFIGAGETVELSATYAAPPAATTTLDVSVPTLGTFRDLPVS